MNKETVLPLVRHLLQFVGGACVAKGWIDEGHLTEGVGIVIGVITYVWYLIEANKKKTA